MFVYKCTSTALVSWPSAASATTSHVLVSHGLSSDMHAVARELLRCCRSRIVLSITFLTLEQINYFYCAENLKNNKLKFKRLCDLAPLLILRISLL
jgi:hypothetical protein